MIHRSQPGEPACNLGQPPERRWVDRLARRLEGGALGERVDELVDLTRVVGGAPRAVVAFYRRPQDYAIHVGATSAGWSRLVMTAFAFLFRQMCIPETSGGFSDYEVCQRVYRDRRGHLHWDRYARVNGSLERLFVARIASRQSQVDETFVLWGIPVRLAFDARVEGEEVVLTLDPSRSSLFARPARVQYRTAEWGEPGGLRTEGDFRVPAIGLHVRTEFRMHVAD